VSKTVQCIEIANSVKKRIVEAELNHIRGHGIDFDWPHPRAIRLEFWMENPFMRVSQVVILLIVAILYVLTTPIAGTYYLVSRFKAIQRLKKEIANLNYIDLAKCHKTKSITTLWKLYGLNEMRYSTEHKLDVLDQWIQVLYAESVATNINVHEIYDNISNSQHNANRSYYLNDPSAVHFHFVPPFQSLLSRLEKSLPLIFE
jgi:hypothetical protein